MKQIAKRLQEMEDPPLVAFIGDMSRTWYQDHHMLMEVMGILRDANDRVVIVNGGQYPFDDYVEKMSVRMGLETFTYNDGVDSMERLAAVYDRPLAMLGGLEALIVFHRLSKPWGWGLGRVVPEAIERGIPIAVVDREGRSYAWHEVPKPRKKSKR